MFHLSFGKADRQDMSLPIWLTDLLPGFRSASNSPFRGSPGV
jgi:hypothetical protein